MRLASRWNGNERLETEDAPFGGFNLLVVQAGPVLEVFDLLAGGLLAPGDEDSGFAAQQTDHAFQIDRRGGVEVDGARGFTQEVLREVIQDRLGLLVGAFRAALTMSSTTRPILRASAMRRPFVASWHTLHTLISSRFPVLRQAVQAEAT